MNYTIKIDPKDDLTIQELERRVQAGYRFISFEYIISFFAVTQRRFSKAILINSSQDIRKYCNKYNLVSSVFGWWGFPWGPIYTIRSFGVNRKGGIDMTDDIMLNISEESLQKREIEYLRTTQFFAKPDKWDLRAFTKSILRDFQFDLNVERIVVGRYINTEGNTISGLTIGLKIRYGKFDEYIEPIRKSLSREFMKHARFSFIDLEKKDELADFLLKQGVTLK